MLRALAIVLEAGRVRWGPPDGHLWPGATMELGMSDISTLWLICKETTKFGIMLDSGSRCSQ